jgi:hypothetical protein
VAAFPVDRSAISSFRTRPLYIRKKMNCSALGSTIVGIFMSMIPEVVMMEEMATVPISAMNPSLGFPALGPIARLTFWNGCVGVTWITP